MGNDLYNIQSGKKKSWFSITVYRHVLEEMFIATVSLRTLKRKSEDGDVAPLFRWSLRRRDNSGERELHRQWRAHPISSRDLIGGARRQSPPPFCLLPV